MRVTLISPDRSLFDGEATSVVAPAFDGLVGILPGHAPFLTVLGSGLLTIAQGGASTRFALDGGVSAGDRRYRADRRRARRVIGDCVRHNYNFGGFGMKRAALSIAVLVSLVGVRPAAAQGVRFGIGGGVLMPLGDYKTADKLGWVVGADATYWLMGSPIGLRVEGDYSQTSHKSTFITSGNSKIIGGLAEVVYALGPKASPVRPYLLGGVGYFNFKESASGTSQSKIGFGAGGGVALKLGTGSTRLFAEARFTSVSTSGGTTTFVPIRAGFRFGR